jgi:hypothetical protein
MTELDAAFWRALRANDFAVPSEPHLTTLTETIVGYLAATDPDLRDSVAYETLATWMSRGVYTPEQLRALGQGLLPRLTRGIETPGTDAVFERSFSMLLLAELLHNHTKSPFLEDAELRGWLAAGLDAFARERDLRGYLADTGWAHASAHTADLLAVAARAANLNADDLHAILTAIAAKLTAPTAHVFVHLEDERLAAAALAVMRRELLDAASVREWLASLTAHDYDFANGWFSDASRANALHNTQTFVRSLYLQLRLGRDLPSNAAELAMLVESALRKLDGGFYATLPAGAHDTEVAT